MSKVIRSVKNVTKGYSATQVKVRNATSNDPWGPTGTEMAEIASMTFDTSTDFFEIMDMLDKRLNDKGKNWRHVLKALKVLDYCLHEGSENVVVWAKDNVYIVKTLREFQYIDEENRDQGLNVRVSAKELTSLLQDEERLRAERKDRKTWKSRVNGIEDSASSDTIPGRHARRQARRGSGNNNHGRTEEEDWEFRMALEASKNQAEEDKKRLSKEPATDADLAKAIKLSQEEEERRQKELEQANADALFDDTPQPQQQQQNQYAFPQQQQQGGFQPQDYQQGGAVDMWGNPVQQPQSTGYLNGIYAQNTAQQYPGQQFAQPTGFQQQQPTGFQQQQTGYMAPATSMPAQPTGFNPYQTSRSPVPTAAANNPYANGLAAPQQPMQPMATGSNNPFAPKMQQQSPPRTATAPSLSTLAEQQRQNQFAAFQQQSQQPFNNFQQQQPQQQQPQYQQPQQQQQLQPQQTAFQPQQQQQQQESKPTDPRHAALEAMLQGGSGQDTFGNTGELRIPAQHTAPGTFVNSAGLSRGPQQTGNNPFYQNSQFTGMPQATLGAGLQPGYGRLVPSHTGPAGVSANPFGVPRQQAQNGQAGGGNLIDF